MISFPELPKFDLNGPEVDFVLNLSESNPNWTILKKVSINNNVPKGESDKSSGSIGRFRSDLSKLKILRGNGIMENTQLDRVSIPFEIKIIDQEPEFNPINVAKTEQKLLQTRHMFTTSNSPSNPLIDQTIKVYKPTEWLDCISRESKRVFVKDNWIVARILLPSISKDTVGLKRLTLE